MTAKATTTTTAPATPAALKAAPAQPTTLAQAETTGQVAFYRMRRNQTLRHLASLAPDSKERGQAERVTKRREAGETI